MILTQLLCGFLCLLALPDQAHASSTLDTSTEAVVTGVAIMAIAMLVCAASGELGGAGALGILGATGVALALVPGEIETLLYLGGIIVLAMVLLFVFAAAAASGFEAGRNHLRRRNKNNRKNRPVRPVYRGNPGGGRSLNRNQGSKGRPIPPNF